MVIGIVSWSHETLYCNLICIANSVGWKGELKLKMSFLQRIFKVLSNVFLRKGYKCCLSGKFLRNLSQIWGKSRDPSLVKSIVFAGQQCASHKYPHQKGHLVVDNWMQLLEALERYTPTKLFSFSDHLSRSRKPASSLSQGPKSASQRNKALGICCRRTKSWQLESWPWTGVFIWFALILFSKYLGELHQFRHSEHSTFRI